MTTTCFPFDVGQFEALCFLQAPDGEGISCEEKHLLKKFLFCFELKECYTNVEGHVLFIGREAECCFSACFMELSQGLDR